jgi:hypothetical protein
MKIRENDIDMYLVSLAFKNMIASMYDKLSYCNCMRLIINEDK